MIKAGVSLNSVDDLAMAGLVTPSPALEAVAARYAVAVTPEMAALIERDPQGPMARQFLPDARNSIPCRKKAETRFPTGASPRRGHRASLSDRVLLKAVHVCPVYCRFCFRREMVGPAGDGCSRLRSLTRRWPISASTRRSGSHPHRGDPLVLSPRRLGTLLEPLSHRPREGHPPPFPRASGRSGTDFGELITLLRATGKTVYVRAPRKPSGRVYPCGAQGLRAARGRGIAMVSQSVLLRSVNDDRRFWRS